MTEGQMDVREVAKKMAINQDVNEKRQRNRWVVVNIKGEER